MILQVGGYDLKRLHYAIGSRSQVIQVIGELIGVPSSLHFTLAAEAFDETQGHLSWHMLVCWELVGVTLLR